MAFDTARLVEQIKIKGCLPTGRFEDQELLDIAYDVMLSEMVPDIIGIREEYFVKTHDAAIIAAQSDYQIHYRAIGGTLREVKVINGSDVTNIERTDVERIRNVTTGTPEYFYVLGNDLILFPTPASTSGTLRQYYYIRPSKFVPVSETGAITAINTATNTVTLTIPTGWTTANTFDLVRGRAHYDIMSIDLAASAVSGSTITFTSSLPASLVVGDYVTLSQETCFPFMPSEGHVALIQSSVAAVLESMGDPAAPAVAQKAQMLKDNFKKVLGVRIQGAPKRLQTRVL